MVTAPSEPELETPEPDELEFGVVAPEPVLADETFVVLDEPFADCCARAGSWPLTSVTAINSQTATNSATVLATTRRRINRTRAIRACLAVGVEAILQCRIRRVRSSRMRER